MFVKVGASLGTLKRRVRDRMTAQRRSLREDDDQWLADCCDFYDSETIQSDVHCRPWAVRVDNEGSLDEAAASLAQQVDGQSM